MLSIKAASVLRLYQQSNYDKTIPEKAFYKNKITADEYFEIVGEKFVKTLDKAKELKIKECDRTCSETITNGCDVKLADGTTEHFALTAEDQINIATAQKAVQSGATAFPYHADNSLCKMYAAADILTIINTATVHKTYHTTYFNHLKAWVNRCTTVEEVNAIHYGDTLPEDLNTSLNAIVNAMKQMVSVE